MAPNATTADIQTTNATTPTIADHFWAFDRSGMDQLNGYVRSCYDALDNVQALYKGRAELEKEFGQKLMALHNKFASAEPMNEDSATQRVVSTIYQEVAKSAQSHIDMSGRLQNEVALQLDTWVKDHRESLDKLAKSLDELYKERQEKLSMLLRIQDYQKRHDEYVSAVTVVNKVVDDWNTAWRNACEQIESLEQERVEFFFDNVWEYANLASARLLVQDEWCEAVRTRLEECNLHNDIVYCINQYGTSTKVPTTSEYVDFFADKIVNKELPPRPRTMSNTAASIQKLSLDHGNTSSSTSGSMMVKRKPLVGSSKDATLNALLKKFEQPSSVPKKPENRHYHHPPVPSVDGRPEISKKPHHNLPPLSIKPPKSPKPQSSQLSQGMAPPSVQQQQNLPRSPVIPKTDIAPRSPNMQHPSSHYNQQQHQAPRSPALASSDLPYRGQYQQPQQHSPAIPAADRAPRSPALAAGDLSYFGQYQQPQHQQQPRSPAMPTADQAPRSPVVQHGHPVMPATADMAPRSPIQQHYQSWSPAMQTAPVDTSYHQQQRQQHMYQPGAAPPPPPQQQQQAPVSAEYAPRSPIQGYAAPPRSPVTPHHPMGGYDMTQHRSPVTQQNSVSMAPRSPMMLQQVPMTNADMYPRSPTVQPAGYPDYNSSQQRWPSQQQQHQGAMQPTYTAPTTSHWSGSSAPYELPDGRRVQFWARAIYDRTAEDDTEISFQKGNLFAVMGESDDSGWYNAELWDETWHCSQGSGCIPFNFMRIV